MFDRSFRVGLIVGGIIVAVCFSVYYLMPRSWLGISDDGNSRCYEMHKAHNIDLDKMNIREILAGTKIDSINETPFDDIYEVVARDNVFYVDAKAHYAFFGHLYDLANNKDLTPKIAIPADNNAHRTIDWKDIPLDNAIVTGNPKGIPIAVFVDPDCPYCRKLESELLDSHDFKVYQLLLPLDGIHQGASRVANHILCSGEPQFAIEDWFRNGNLSINADDCMGQINTIKAFANSEGINGTPVIVRQDGEMIFGYRPINELLAWAMGDADE